MQAPLAGIANWAFRRQSRRHGAGLAVSEMIASFGIRYANRKTMGMLTIVARRAPRRRCRSSAPTPTRWPRPPARSRRRAPTWWTSTWAAPSRRSARPAPAPRCCADPEHAAADRRGDGARGGHPGDREDAARADAVRRRGPSRSPGGFERPAPRRSACTRAPRPRSTRARADHRITAEVVEAVSIPVIASGDVSRRRGRPPRARGRRLRGGRRRPGGARQPVGVRRHPARRRPAAAGLGEVVDELAAFAADARLALGDAARDAGTCASSIPGTWPATPSPRRSSRALLTIPTAGRRAGTAADLAAAPAAA